MTPAQERELRSRMLGVLLTYRNYETSPLRTQAAAWCKNDTEWLTPESAEYLLVACRVWRDTGGFRATTYATIEALVKANTKE